MALAEATMPPLRGLWSLRGGVDSHWNTRLCHVAFGLADRERPVMKNGRRQHRAGMPAAHALYQMVEGAHAARSDHRHANNIGHGTCEFDVEAALGAVAVHRRQ